MPLMTFSLCQPLSDQLGATASYLVRGCLWAPLPAYKPPSMPPAPSLFASTLLARPPFLSLLISRCVNPATTLIWQAIEAGLESLEPHETQMILQLYPQEAGGKRTRTREVAERLGCTTAKVRRVEQRALSKLRAKRQLRDLYLQVANA